MRIRVATVIVATAFVTGACIVAAIAVTVEQISNAIDAINPN